MNYKINCSRIFKSGVLLGLMLTAIITSTAIAAASNQYLITDTQAKQAYEYALAYVKNEVAYLYGGRQSVEAYLDGLAKGKTPGEDIGVDASGLIVNAYRHVIPNIRFYFDQSQTTTVADATSSLLYNFNCKPITQTELQPGDLIFFQNAAGNITGVAVFSHISGDVIHFITASVNAGKVVLTNALLSGNYWKTNFAGFGRLQYTISE